MREEIGEIPDAVARLLAEGRAEFQAAGRDLRTKDPAAIVTVARGSSDHAASFLKYAIELVAGVPVASVGPSVQSIYGRELRLQRCAAIAISQSGKSPDIVAMAESARRNGAYAIALTNTAGSPLAAAADLSIDLRCGIEKSVAATKSFAASIAAGLAILAHWTEDSALLAALDTLPVSLRAAMDCDWSPMLSALDGRTSLYVLGRGPALAIASEAALKLKETCGIHAEAYSSAEVLHGPARIVENGFPILALAADDSADTSIAETVARLAGQGATAFSTVGGGTRLPTHEGGHPLVSALSLIVPFYLFVEALARHRGFDPDKPPHLRKVTETV